MRKHCLLRLTAMLLACILLIGCSAPGQQAAAAETASSGNAAEAPAASAAASAAQTGKQLPQMHRQDYPCLTPECGQGGEGAGMGTHHIKTCITERGYGMEQCHPYSRLTIEGEERGEHQQGAQEFRQ